MGVSEKSLKIFHSARGSNPGPLGCEPSALPLHHRVPIYKNGVKLNLSKCEIAKNEVTFLGYRISREGSQPDPKNVEAVLEMKPPTKVKEVRRFLGMTGFYRKHIHNYAKIATLLTNLTRKTQTFKWTDQCQTAFETLKEYLSKAPILVRAQPHQPFILVTDAGPYQGGGSGGGRLPRGATPRGAPFSSPSQQS